jgi:hypothetical protein
MKRREVNKRTEGKQRRGGGGRRKREEKARKS